MITRILLAPDAPGSAAVVAPAPAPVPNPAPAPVPAPSPAPSPTAADRWAAQDAEIDAALNPPAKPAPPAESSKPEVKPAATTPAKPAAVAPAKSAEVKPAAESPKQLREQYEATKREHAIATAEVTRLKDELAEARRAGEATSALTAELATAQKERDQLRQDLNIARYAPSEAVTAAQKELGRHANRAKAVISSLTVTDEAGNQSQASWDKFQKIFTTMDKGPAISAIKAMFGENSDVALQQYWKLDESSERVDAAETEDRKTWNDRVTKETAQRATQREGMTKMVSAVEKDIVAKNPAVFGDDPEDAEGNEMFKKGMQLAQEATDPAKFNAKTPQEQALIIAHSKYRIAAYPRLMLVNGRLKNELATLKAKLADLEGGNLPPETRPGGTEQAPKEKGWEEDFDAISGELQAR